MVNSIYTVNQGFFMSTFRYLINLVESTNTRHELDEAVRGRFSGYDVAGMESKVNDFVFRHIYPKILKPVIIQLPKRFDNIDVIHDRRGSLVDNAWTFKILLSVADQFQELVEEENKYFIQDTDFVKEFDRAIKEQTAGWKSEFTAELGNVFSEPLIGQSFEGGFTYEDGTPKENVFILFRLNIGK